ncbi:MAG TPA: molecular chaperone SurA [Thiotrichales bacterium]|nr:molecular chaperone SurA [Thiotrichales bacterium]
MIQTPLRQLLLLLVLLVPWSVNQAGEVLDRIVAVVDEDVVLQSELEAFISQVKAQLQARNTPLPPEDALIRQALDRLILNRIQLQLAAQTGIRVDDQSLQQTMARIARRNKLTLEQFRVALEQEGLSYPRFRETVRQEMIIARLQQRNVVSRIQVTEEELEQAMSENADKLLGDRSFHMAHILISVPEGATPEVIAEKRALAERLVEELRGGADFAHLAATWSAGQKALEGGDLGWFQARQVPRRFVTPLAAMQPGEVSEPIRSPSGFHIIKLVEAKGGQRHMVQQTHARHILIKTNAVVSDADARSKLEEIRNRILAGEPFADLARTYSEDTVSARQGGDLGWTSPGEMVPEFEGMAEALRPGEISPPFRTQFGWHIVEVLERRQVDMTENFQKSQLVRQIRKRKQQEALQLWLQKLRDEAWVEYRVDV